VPAKEFLETAAVYRTVTGASEFGIQSGPAVVDFAVSQARKNQVVDQLYRGLSGLMAGRKITTLAGSGALSEGHRVVVVDGADAGTEIVGRHVVLASGSVPRTLPGFDIDGQLILTSDEFLDLQRLPESVAVIGGGVVGCEFASLLSDLGSRVVVVEALESILTECDRDVVRVVERSFKKRGIEVITGVQAAGHMPRPDGSGTVLALRDGHSFDVNAVVVSVGRRPCTEGLVIGAVGVELDQHGFVLTNELQQTHAPNVWAVGDIVSGAPQLAHVGFAEAIVVVKGILGEPVLPVDYERVPWAIYCHPEVAFAGLTEEKAKAQGRDVLVKKDPFGGNSRARIMGDTDGLVKVIAERQPGGGAGRILGVHIAGPWATELLGAGYLAVNWDATPSDVAQFFQPHPSLSETLGETMLALTGRGLHVA